MFGIYVKIRGSTFQSQTIRRGIHWEKHQESHKQVMALFADKPRCLPSSACQRWTQWGYLKTSRSGSYQAAGSGELSVHRQEGLSGMKLISLVIILL